MTKGPPPKGAAGHDDLRALLEQVAHGGLSVDDALQNAATLAVPAAVSARIDTDRLRRVGSPEVVYGEGKTPEQVLAVAKLLDDNQQNLLVTRANVHQANALAQQFDDVAFHEDANVIVRQAHPVDVIDRTVAVVCAGTTDRPVAEEAAHTLRFLGLQHDRIYDVGVAGLSRILSQVDRLQEADAVIVVAGMDGALPAVVGGLVACPVVAVPTSVGYGAAFKGVAPLLGMLNACAAGLTVVNIDNGFGAARAVHRMLRPRPRPT